MSIETKLHSPSELMGYFANPFETLMKRAVKLNSELSIVQDSEDRGTVPIRSPGGFPQTVPQSAEGVRCALTARPSAADSGSRLEDGKDERCAPACIQIHTSNE